MWTRFVDIVTIIWLVIFTVNYYYPNPILVKIDVGLLSVFVADLILKSRAAPNLRTFVRKQWTDILMVIPYFRIFRVLRFTRLLRFMKAARLARAGRFPGFKAIESFRRRLNRISKRIRNRKMVL